MADWSWRGEALTMLAALVVYVAAEVLFYLRFNRKFRALFQARNEDWLRQQQSLQEQINQLIGQVNSLQAESGRSAADAPRKGSYRQAISLAQQGFDAQSIAASADISRGEAELIAALHRTQP